ncbi:hypothetical protein ACO0QE_002101 [Hanseniaspora vineae]
MHTRNNKVFHPANATAQPSSTSSSSFVRSVSKTEGLRLQKSTQGLRKKKPKNKDTVGPWKLGKTLGKGSSGRVRLAKHMQTGQLAAIKIVPKKHHKRNISTTVDHQSLKPANNNNNKDHGTNENHGKNQSEDAFEETPIPYGIEREIIIMKLVTHPNIMALYEVWENKSELYLVLEYVDGGELFDYLVTHGKLCESEAVYYFKQIIEGVSYLHKFNICHRDLKPENLLLDKKNKKIKIADFGMAALEVSDKLLQTSCGSPHYASPEIVTGKKYHGSSSDVWSCGIILFALLCGHLPFNDNNVKKLLLKVQSGKFQMPEKLSDEAKDLISKMLVVNPLQRINIEEILYHPLLNKYSRSTRNKSNSNIFKMLRTTDEKDIDGENDVSKNNSSQYLSARIGSNKKTQLPIKPEIVTLKASEEIDPTILESLQILWHGVSKNTIIANLLKSGVTDEKIFYSLLYQYQVKQHHLNQEQKRLSDAQNNAEQQKQSCQKTSIYDSSSTTSELLPALSATNEKEECAHDYGNNTQENSNDTISTADGSAEEPSAPLLKPKSQFSSRQSLISRVDSYVKLNKSSSMTRTTSGVRSFVASRSISSKPGLGISGAHGKSPRKPNLLSRSSSSKGIPRTSSIPVSPRRFFRSPSSNHQSPNKMFSSQSKRSLYSLNSISKKSINLKNYLINDHYIENEENPLPEYKNEFAILCEQILFSDDKQETSSNIKGDEIGSKEETRDFQKSKEICGSTETLKAFVNTSNEEECATSEINTTTTQHAFIKDNDGNSLLKEIQQPQGLTNVTAQTADESYFKRLSLDPRLKKSTIQNLTALLKKNASLQQRNLAGTKPTETGDNRFSSIKATPSKDEAAPIRQDSASRRTSRLVPSTKDNKLGLGMISMPSGVLKTTTTFQDLSSYIHAINFGEEKNEADGAEPTTAKTDDTTRNDIPWDQTTIASRIETAEMLTARKPGLVSLENSPERAVPGIDENVFEDLEQGNSSFSSSAYRYSRDNTIDDSDGDLLQRNVQANKKSVSQSSDDGSDYDSSANESGERNKMSIPHRKIASIDSFGYNDVNANIIHTAATVDVRGSLYVNRPQNNDQTEAVARNPEFRLTDTSNSSNLKFDDRDSFAGDGIKDSALNLQLMNALDDEKTVKTSNEFNGLPTATSEEIIAKFKLTPDKKNNGFLNFNSPAGQNGVDNTYSFLNFDDTYSKIEHDRQTQFLKFKHSESSLDMAQAFKNLDDELRHHNKRSESGEKKATSGLKNETVDSILEEDDELSSMDDNSLKSFKDKQEKADSKKDSRLMEISVADMNIYTKPLEVQKIANPIRERESSKRKHIDGNTSHVLLNRDDPVAEMIADMNEREKTQNKRVTMLFDNDEDKKFSLKMTDSEDGKPIRKKVSITNLKSRNRSGNATPISPLFDVEKAAKNDNGIDTDIKSNTNRNSSNNFSASTVFSNGKNKNSKVSFNNSTSAIVGPGEDVNRMNSTSQNKRNSSNMSTSSATKRENWFSKMINKLGRRISSSSRVESTNDRFSSGSRNTSGHTQNTIIEEKQQHYTSISFEKLKELATMHMENYHIKYQPMKQYIVQPNHIKYNCTSSGDGKLYRFQLEIDDNVIVISKKFTSMSEPEDRQQFQEFNKNISKMIKDSV